MHIITNGPTAERHQVYTKIIEKYIQNVFYIKTSLKKRGSTKTMQLSCQNVKEWHLFGCQNPFKTTNKLGLKIDTKKSRMPRYARGVGGWGAPSSRLICVFRVAFVLSSSRIIFYRICNCLLSQCFRNETLPSSYV